MKQSISPHRRRNEIANTMLQLANQKFLFRKSGIALRPGGPPQANFRCASGAEEMCLKAANEVAFSHIIYVRFKCASEEPGRLY
jgi:hypothetical protein